MRAFVALGRTPELQEKRSEGSVPIPLLSGCIAWFLTGGPDQDRRRVRGAGPVPKDAVVVLGIDPGDAAFRRGSYVPYGDEVPGLGDWGHSLYTALLRAGAPHVFLFSVMPVPPYGAAYGIKSGLHGEYAVRTPTPEVMEAYTWACRDALIALRPRAVLCVDYAPYNWMWRGFSMQAKRSQHDVPLAATAEIGGRTVDVYRMPSRASLRRAQLNALPLAMNHIAMPGLTADAAMAAVLLRDGPLSLFNGRLQFAMPNGGVQAPADVSLVFMDTEIPGVEPEIKPGNNYAEFLASVVRRIVAIGGGLDTRNPAPPPPLLDSSGHLRPPRLLLGGEPRHTGEPWGIPVGDRWLKRAASDEADDRVRPPKRPRGATPTAEARAYADWFQGHRASRRDFVNRAMPPAPCVMRVHTGTPVRTFGRLLAALLWWVVPTCGAQAAAVWAGSILGFTVPLRSAEEGIRMARAGFKDADSKCAKRLRMQKLFVYETFCLAQREASGRVPEHLNAVVEAGRLFREMCLREDDEGMEDE